MTPMRAIREKCIDCCCGFVSEVKRCTCSDCPLYNFRLGKNPNIKRKYTEEQRQQMAARLAKIRPENRA